MYIKRYPEEGGDDDANKQQQQEESAGKSLIFNILKLKQLWITQLDGLDGEYLRGGDD